MTENTTPMEGETPDVNVNEPFTIEERIKQLSEIDKSIVQLMVHTSSAMGVLTTQPKGITPEQQKQTFKDSMDGLLSTLHAVDVHMKRQIMGLEEAGIIKLSNEKAQMGEDARIVSKASLEPNGVGTIGNLDVGWLNSQSNKVERDMEAELWSKAKGFLENFAIGGDGSMRQ